MLTALSKFLPLTAIAWPWWLVLALVVAGLIAWFRGVHFSRALLTMTIIIGAAALGMKLPKLTGLGMEPMAAAILLAVIGGLIGFCLHRWCIGLVLTAIGTAATGLQTLILRGLPPFDLPVWKGSSADAIKAWWKEFGALIPAADLHALGWAMAIAAACGVILTFISHKWATCLLWSLLGVCTWIFAGTWLIAGGHWPGLAELPGSPVVQTMVAGVLVFLGAGIQAGSVRKPAAPASIGESPVTDSNIQPAKPAA